MLLEETDVSKTMGLNLAFELGFLTAELIALLEPADLSKIIGFYTCFVPGPFTAEELI